MNNNNTYNSSSGEIFSGLFENRFSKISIVFGSFVIDLLNAILTYGIIWYEGYGLDIKRTLINKLVSSICWAAMIEIPLLQISEIPRYFFGPQSPTFCFFQSFLKNAFKWQILLLLDASIVVRYILIFWVKNPGAFQDDFWNIFVNIWILGMSVITNFTLFSRPVKMPLHYYTCTDLNPSDDVNLPHSSGFIDIFSLLLHFLIKIRIGFFKLNKRLPCCRPNMVKINQIFKNVTKNFLLLFHETDSIFNTDGQNVEMYLNLTWFLY